MFEKITYLAYFSNRGKKYPKNTSSNQVKLEGGASLSLPSFNLIEQSSSNSFELISR